jgi:mannose-6-phosphate isomerase-like protein (cupin superfamily)/plastocyanin
MLHTGDVLENPVTGERVTFRRTAADTQGELVDVEVELRPDAAVAGTHVHPFQEERFTVLSGTVGFAMNGRRRVATRGDEVVVPPGTPHRFWNAGSTEAHFRTEVRPALGFEDLLETMFGFARGGQTNDRGLPNPLRLAAVGEAYFDTVRLPYVPAWMQRAALALGAPIARALGYGLGTRKPRAARPGRSIKTLLAGMLAVVLFAGAACAPSSEPQGDVAAGSADDDAIELVIEDGQFQPQELDVPAGEEVTVEIRNDDRTVHDFAIESLDLNTGTIEPGEVATATFTPSEGTTEFECTYHGGMTGVIEAS